MDGVLHTWRGTVDDRALEALHAGRSTGAYRGRRSPDVEAIRWRERRVGL